MVADMCLYHSNMLFKKQATIGLFLFDVSCLRMAMSSRGLAGPFAVVVPKRGPFAEKRTTLRTALPLRLKP